MGDAGQDRSAHEFGQAARELGNALGEVTSALTKALGLSEKAVDAGKKWAAHADTPEERDYIVKGVYAMTLIVGDTLRAWSGKLDAAQKAMAGWEVGIVKRRNQTKPRGGEAARSLR
jgi:hypothetical protein